MNHINLVKKEPAQNDQTLAYLTSAIIRLRSRAFKFMPLLQRVESFIWFKPFKKVKSESLKNSRVNSELIENSVSNNVGAFPEFLDDSDTFCAREEKEWRPGENNTH